MTTKISLLSSLITALLLGTALTVAAIDFSVPAIPDSLTNIQKDLDKAAAAKATPAPTPDHIRSQLPYTFSPPSNDPKPTTSNPSDNTFYNRYGAGSQKPTSDTEDWHKKNKKHKTANGTYDGSSILYNKPKPTSDAQGRFSVDFGAIKSPAQQTQTSHTSKTTEKGKVMPDNDDHPGKHKNKHKHGHHHDDDQNQGND